MTPRSALPNQPPTVDPSRGRLISGVALTLLAVGIVVAVVVARPWDGPDGSPEAAVQSTDGTQVVVTPVGTDTAELSGELIDSAVLLLADRAASAGIRGTEVSRHGDTNILLAFPGTADQATIDLLLRPADGGLRPVLAVSDPAPTEPGTDTLSGTTKESPDSPSDVEYYLTTELAEQFATLDCTRRTAGPDAEADAADEGLVACAADGSAKYVLGPVEMAGTAIADASTVRAPTAGGAETNEWIIVVELTPTGTTAFADVTARLAPLASPLNQLALIPDGVVISAPTVYTPIPGGSLTISGDFDEEQATVLAAHLNGAAHALRFEIRAVTEP